MHPRRKTNQLYFHQLPTLEVSRLRFPATLVQRTFARKQRDEGRGERGADKKRQREDVRDLRVRGNDVQLVQSSADVLLPNETVCGVIQVLEHVSQLRSAKTNQQQTTTNESKLRAISNAKMSAVVSHATSSRAKVIQLARERTWPNNK